jgi:hypothetical protein
MSKKPSENAPVSKGDDGWSGPEAASEQADFIIIGKELASAADAEERRKARENVESSPMPDQVYDFWRGEMSLIRPVALPLDAATAELCARFMAADGPARERMRAAISMNEFYTLLTFAQRAAVFAIRGCDASWLEAGMTAIAMIDARRVDYRDILVALGLLHHAARRAGMDAAELFRQTAKRSEPETASLVTGFGGWSERDKDLRSSWGYDEVETDVGVGLIGWGFKTYHPTYDLKAIAIEIADFVATDKYQPSPVELASELPHIWLEAVDHGALDRAMKSIRAVASVSGSLRPDESPGHGYQQFSVFPAELASESDSRRLLEIARRKKPSGYCMIALAEGRLFCLIVARSFFEGIAPFETQQSLTRFEMPMTEILRRHGAKGASGVSSTEPARWTMSVALRKLIAAIRQRLARTSGFLA